MRLPELTVLVKTILQIIKPISCFVVCMCVCVCGHSWFDRCESARCNLLFYNHQRCVANCLEESLSSLR